MTARYEAWMRAYTTERAAIAGLREAYDAASAAAVYAGTPDHRRAQRRLAKANAAHCRAMTRERAARARLSRADTERAHAFHATYDTAKETA